MRINFDDAHVGDHVRVTRVYEGVIVERARSGIDLRNEDNDLAKTVFIPNDPATVTIERVEPEYVPDTLYQDDDGTVWLYAPINLAYPWRKVNTNTRTPFASPKRPLVRLAYADDVLEH